MSAQHVRNRTLRSAAIVAVVTGGMLAGPLSGIAHAAPLTFTVNTAGNAADTNIGDGICDTDNGTTGSQCTLRAALQEANANAGLDTIDFAMASPYLITLASPGLPTITSPVVIDGTSEPGFSPSTGVIVRVDAAGQQYGFNLTTNAAGSTIDGLEIDRAGTAGIRLAADSNVVSGNYIGTTAGSLAKCVGQNYCSNGTGVLISGGNNNTIGGTTPAARNVISNNNSYQVEVSGASSGNTLEGNYVGPNVAGTGKFANNYSYGIMVDGAASTNTTIGGSASGAGNLISGNYNDGIDLTAGSTTVLGNIIGLKAGGAGALANGDGVDVTGSNTAAQIGGTSSGAGNVISGNGSEGVYLQGGPATVAGNLIGLDSTGTTAMPNGDSGVEVLSAGAVIGGTAAGSRNVISGNADEGVYVSSASGVTVQGNYIGTDITGGTAIPSGNYYDVDVESSSNALVDNNVLVGTSTGLYADSTDGLVATNNKIGTDATGEHDLGNSSYGIDLESSPDSTIGEPNAGNVISGSSQNGILVDSSDDSSIQGNLIGTDANGTTALGNTSGGISVQSSLDATIGGTGTGAGNVIAGSDASNSTPGIELYDADDASILGNSIGVGSTGGALPNGIGVLADSNSARDQIGGTAAGAGNVIADNSGTGVVINGEDDSIRGNSIHDNGGLGIDLGQNGVTHNDAGDTDTGPNRLQNFPVLSTSASNANGTQITGTLNSRPNRQYDLDFFSSSACDNSGYGQGATYLGSTTVTTDGSGNASFQTTVSGSAPAASYITSTATDDGYGDTSEFSQCLADQGGLPAASIANTSASEGAGTMTFTVTLSLAPVFTPVTVDYTTADGTATSPADYTATSGTLTFGAGDTSEQINVPIVNDNIDEPDETFTVTLSNPTNAMIAPGQGTATGTIVDDDPTPTLNIANAAPVTEPDTGSVNQTFTVTLSGPSSQTVTVIARTVAGTATEGSDYVGNAALLTFNPGDTTENFQVAVLGDTLDEANENYSVQLESPTNATIGTGSGTGQILDNDPPPSLSISDVTAPEGNSGTKAFTFVITMSAPSGRLVRVSIPGEMDGTATAGSDYIARNPVSLHITAGKTSVNYIVKVKGDRVVEPDETFYVNIDPATTVNATVAKGTGTGTIQNDDS